MSRCYVVYLVIVLSSFVVWARVDVSLSEYWLVFLGIGVSVCWRRIAVRIVILVGGQLVNR